MGAVTARFESMRLAIFNLISYASAENCMGRDLHHCGKRGRETLMGEPCRRSCEDSPLPSWVLYSGNKDKSYIIQRGRAFAKVHAHRIGDVVNGPEYPADLAENVVSRQRIGGCVESRRAEDKGSLS